MRATPKPGGIACCSAQVRGPRIRRLRVACSAPPDSPYQSLERAVQVINRVIALGERSKWGADQPSGGGGSSPESGDEGPGARWVQFGAVHGSRVAVQQGTAGVSGGGKLLRDYLALPVDQYSLLDPKWISREDGGQFRFSLPLQDLVSVDLQPEIYISVAPEPQHCRVSLVGTRAALGSPEIDQAFKLNVTAVLSQRQRRRLPPLPRPPDHLPGRPVFRLRRWAAAARGRKWPAEDGSAAAAAELQPWAAGPAGTASRAGTPAPPPPAEAATGTAAAGAPAAVAAAAAAAAEAAPFPGERVYISHDVNDEDEYAEEPELASAGITVAELEMAELDEDTPPPPSSSATIDGSSSSSLSSSSSSSSSAAGPAGGAGRGVSPGPAPGGQHALLHCRAHVTMAVRVPGALRVVPNALLGYAGSLLLRAVLTATLPNFLNLLAADYSRWAGVDDPPGGDGGGGRQLDAPVGELFADAAATVREGRERRQHERPEGGDEAAAVRQLHDMVV